MIKRESVLSISNRVAAYIKAIDNYRKTLKRQEKPKREPVSILVVVDVAL